MLVIIRCLQHMFSSLIQKALERNKECMYEMLAQRTVTQKYAIKGFTIEHSDF